MDLAKLSAPFPPEAISWRVGSTTRDKSKGMALAYIDARDVMQRLDDVCGVDGWQARYSHVTPNGVICEIGIHTEAGWIWKANGAGETHVEAQKGAASDAFKRAAVLWGVGRYLYDLESPWVALEKYGNSYRIPASEQKRLTKLLEQKITLSEAKELLLNADSLEALKQAWAEVQTAGYAKELEELKNQRKGELQ